jgi:hypothetical protein
LARQLGVSGSQWIARAQMLLALLQPINFKASK